MMVARDFGIGQGVIPHIKKRERDNKEAEAFETSGRTFWETQSEERNLGSMRVSKAHDLITYITTTNNTNHTLNSPNITEGALKGARHAQHEGRVRQCAVY